MTRPSLPHFLNYLSQCLNNHNDSQLVKLSNSRYKRLYDNDNEKFLLQMEYLKQTKKPFDYFYKKKAGDSQLYLCTTEAIFDLSGSVIGKREFARPIHLPSQRQIIEQHFKRHKTNLAASQNINISINLTEVEEVILYMLVNGYTQNEIASYLNYSRSNIVKIIAVKICPKFNITYLSCKELISKATYLGYNYMIPKSFLYLLNPAPANS